MGISEKTLEAAARFILRRSVLLLLLGAAWAAVGLWLGSTFKLYDEPGAWAPQSHPLVQRTHEIEARFGGSNHVVIMVTPRDGDIFNPTTLQKVKGLTFELTNLKGVITYTVHSIGNENARYMRFQLLEDGEEFIENKPLLETVPEPGDEAAMGRVKWGAHHNPLILGPLVSTSPDGKSTVITADFRTSPFKDTLGNVLPYTDPVAIYKQVQALTAKYNDAHDHVEASGTPIIIGWVNSDGLYYVAIAFAAFLVAMGVMLFLFIRRLSGALLPVLVGLYASVSGFGIYHLAFGDVLESAAVLIAPFIIVAAGSCHAVQFVRRLFDESLPKAESIEDALIDTFALRFKPMVVSLLTDAMSFVVLSFVPFSNVSLLGQVTTFGLVSVTLAEFLLLMPAMYWVLRLFHAKRAAAEPEGRQVDAFTEKIARLMVENGTAQAVVLGVVAAAFAWSIYVVPKLTFSQDNTYAIHNSLTRSWEGNPIYEMEMNIRKYFGGVYPLVVMVKTKGDVTLSSDLDVLRSIDAFETEMKSVDGVGATLGLPDYLKVMNRLFYGDKPEAFTLPPSEQGLAEYVFMYEDGEPGVFDAIVSPGHKAGAIVIMVRDTSEATVERVMAAAQEAAKKHLESDKLEAVIGGGTIAISQAFNESIAKWLLLGTILSAVGTFVLAVVMLGSVTISLFLLAPLVVGIFLTIAIMWACGVPMDSNMTTALAIASGVGIDSEVYLLYRFREEYALYADFNEALVQAFTKIRRALLTSNLALIIGCWALIPIPLYVGTIGFGMGLILLICFLMSYFVTPALWAILRPGYLTANVERRELVPEARRAEA